MLALRASWPARRGSTVRIPEDRIRYVRHPALALPPERPRIAPPAMTDETTNTGPERPAEKGAGGLDRRDFVREGLRNLFRPIARVVGNRIERMRVPPAMLSANLAKGERGGAAPDPALDGRLLRPPGAAAEEIFLERCSRSGRCAEACPVHAIHLMTAEEAGSDPRRKGTPRIDPQLQACVVCEGLYCMHACPSGALTPVSRERIAMGVAEVRHDLCVRTTGEECQLCVDKCPLGLRAIEIPFLGAPVEVKTDGCTGCGVCEMVCPTDPRAIVVRQRP